MNEILNKVNEKKKKKEFAGKLERNKSESKRKKMLE